MQAADVLYGVTMQQQGVSTLMSVRLVDADGVDGAVNGHANGQAAANGRVAVASH